MESKNNKKQKIKDFFKQGIKKLSCILVVVIMLFSMSLTTFAAEVSDTEWDGLTVPSGATYTVSETGETLQAGATMPLGNSDVLYWEDYKFTCVHSYGSGTDYTIKFNFNYVGTESSPNIDLSFFTKIYPILNCRIEKNEFVETITISGVNPDCQTFAFPNCVNLRRVYLNHDFGRPFNFSGSTLIGAKNFEAFYVNSSTEIPGFSLQTQASTPSFDLYFENALPLKVSNVRSVNPINIHVPEGKEETAKELFAGYEDYVSIVFNDVSNDVGIFEILSGSIQVLSDAVNSIWILIISNQLIILLAGIAILIAALVLFERIKSI